MRHEASSLKLILLYLLVPGASQLLLTFVKAHLLCRMVQTLS
jgi:hypothetical protein